MPPGVKDEEDGPEVIKEQRRKLWFDTRVSVTDIVTILLVAAGVIAAYSTLDKRITVLETLIAQVKLDDAHSNSDRTNIRREMRETRSEMINRLDRIDDKLDRLVDRYVRQRREHGIP